MSRLYLRIYMAFLASLLVFALIAGVAAGLVRLFDERTAKPWPEIGLEIAERLLPADREQATLVSELTFWHERTGFALGLFSKENKLVAYAGQLPIDIDQTIEKQAHKRLWRAWDGVYGLTLRDGRRLVAVQPSGDHYARHILWLSILMGIAVAIAVGFYPLIRYLTRRLEKLEQGVARFGQGDLSSRVAIKGRDEIANVAKTFNASADRIEDLLKAHKTLLANASHELRSPLSRLRMAIEKIEPSQTANANRAEIVRNIADLDALVDEILLAARLQPGVVYEFQWEALDIVGLLAEEASAYDANLTVTTGTPIFVKGDARLLRRLFRNLFHNAKVHGGDASPDVEIVLVDASVCVQICDRGPGVAPGEEDKIFEPFYRSRGLYDKDGGAGLGLALVKQIAEKHGGSVRYRNRQGGGACFEVHLSALENIDEFTNAYA